MTSTSLQQSPLFPFAVKQTTHIPEYLPIVIKIKFSNINVGHAETDCLHTTRSSLRTGVFPREVATHVLTRYISCLVIPNSSFTRFSSYVLFTSHLFHPLILTPPTSVFIPIFSSFRHITPHSLRHRRTRRTVVPARRIAVTIRRIVVTICRKLVVSAA